MSTVSSNRVNNILDEGNLNTIRSLFGQIQALVPFMVGLNPQERQRLPKINVSNKAFTEDALRILQSNPGYFPSFMNVSFMRNDLTLFQQLDELAALSRQLTEKLEDTMMLAGSEAYVSALSVYRLTQAAAIAGMPGSDSAYQYLNARFNGQGTVKTSEQAGGDAAA